MAEPSEHTPAAPRSTRRDFLKQSAMAASMVPLMGVGAPAAEAADQASGKPARRPNILLVISDQYRWDFVCAYGKNPMAFTPNLDAMLRRGTSFQNAFTNQPLCSPARSCLFTGQYATKTGVWTLVGPPNIPGLSPDAITLATELRKAGYSTNYIGKWHLAPRRPITKPFSWLGYVPPEERGGFLDLWQASNVLELTSHPYHGTIWDGQGNAMDYKDIYRVDYLTELAVRFLRRKQDKPFLLVLSQLEPHQQNDLNGFGPPKGYGEKFRNPYVPPDLRPFPGDWPYQLANYYGDCKSIDESMGRIFQTLKEENLDDNTIVVFLSDHGCHFRTRNHEYKRSPQDASTHIPLMIQGPGFDNGRIVQELVNLVDVAPSVLAAAGLPIPASMQGRNFIPLIHDAKARETWPNEVFIQVSQSETARALRTPEWTYVALAPDSDLSRDPGSAHYQDYQLYNNAADPAQVVNLAGRADIPSLVHYFGGRSIRKITDHFRERLIARMVEAGEPRPQIKRWNYYP
ncbi:MAG: sulfatase-like hydrolase/transferase [Verrucomicrobiota bacterium]|nr:sulfatase-like hydrolase/transferase [Verrucomicrobiota bacterium]MDE3067253.1 sulfatase-like hydrolase/transferase [Verrucomicrobiota bacterium]